MKEKVTAFAVKTALAYLESNPDKNMPKMLRLVDRYDRKNEIINLRTQLHTVIEDPDNNWYRLAKSLWTDIDDAVRKTFFTNFIINVMIRGDQLQKENVQKYDCNIPWGILMDPTSACNLHCTGCWASEYGNKLNLTFDEMDGIITQAKALGAFMFLFSGGEPLVRKDDIIRLCEKHSECMFLAFTNATLIDEAFADEMLRVKNFVPAISVEGFEDATDDRRGKGTYQAVVKAMDILKSKKLLFGISCCYTSKNYQVIGSDEYFDDMIAKGAKFAWFFTYMPVGKEAVTELMVTPEQREYMYHKIRDFRSTKSIFSMDFWNDGEYAGGCVAGGRRYLHINANGDIEPCAFIHYSDSNIRDKSLLEALQGPLFMAYKEGQPFNHNHLRPCPLLDNPEKLRAMVDHTGAKSTDMQNPEDVHDLADKCEKAATNWAPVADDLWEISHGGCAGCTGCTPAKSKENAMA